MPLLKIDPSRLDLILKPWFSECTPKILVVTDGLNYSPALDFGLTEFVATLRTATIHGMTPIVVTARFDPNGVLSYNAATDPQIQNFKFTDATHGLLRSRYDVVFLLSVNRSSGPKLVDEPGALDAVIKFMQAGGGLFATGDHEDLGAGMCMDIPRVNRMRLWQEPATPSAGGTDRLTTNLPGRGDQLGSDDTYEFSDQSDRFPQRLFVNFWSKAGGDSGLPNVRYAHPLLQIPCSVRAIEVFPDHPHEGECVIPTDLTTKLPDLSQEWPIELGGTQRVSPEMVALTMSHGNGFPGKQPVVPRSFIAICAYDGQRAGVGRVVTDATWHHFVNVNIKPGLAAIAGRDLADIKQYYANLANWLMPKRVRYCRRFPWILRELLRYPLFEEIPPAPRKTLDGTQLRAIGALVETSLLARHAHGEVAALIEDALEEALGVDQKLRLEELGREYGRVSARDAGLAALGSLTLATAERFNELDPDAKINGEKVFADVGPAATREGVQRYLEGARSDVQRMDQLITAALTR